MKHIVYKITNLINQKYYIGKHSCNCAGGCTYLGSGTEIQKAIKKFGRENFKFEKLRVFESEGDCIKYERFLLSGINKDDETCYNIACGMKQIKSKKKPTKIKKKKEIKPFTLNTEKCVVNIMLTKQLQQRLNYTCSPLVTSAYLTKVFSLVMANKDIDDIGTRKNFLRSYGVSSRGYYNIKKHLKQNKIINIRTGQLLESFYDILNLSFKSNEVYLSKFKKTKQKPFNF